VHFKEWRFFGIVSAEMDPKMDRWWPFSFQMDGSL
jgi:hypothetical protein